MQNGVSNAILQLMKVLPRVINPSDGHYFLLGPRGTGKTLWASYHYPSALRIDLLNPETMRQLTARPERLIELVETNSDKQQIIIDEVQKLPELLDVVHLLIEQKKSRQFILTGSSARKLRKQGVNLLGGRAAKKILHPYLAFELGQDFSIKKALTHGMLPLVWASSEPEEILKSYNALYLKEEVQAEGLIRNIGAFARFLETISFSYGSVLNINNISREAEVNRKTVEGFIIILEDLLLAFRLNIFSKRAKRELKSHPKFYFFDVGVFRANRPRGPFDDISDLEGLCLEGLVFQHLRAWCDYSIGGNELFYWQTRQGIEVDFVIYGESGIYAIEVKKTTQLRPEDFKGLELFQEDYPIAKRYILYQGKERFIRNGVHCIPCEEFLLNLKPNSILEL